MLPGARLRSQKSSLSCSLHKQIAVAPFKLKVAGLLLNSLPTLQAVVSAACYGSSVSIRQTLLLTNSARAKSCCELLQQQATGDETASTEVKGE
ncbi:hypothetical protein XANCAGTX0491_008979 [Xanthoria calcicola]